MATDGVRLIHHWVLLNWKFVLPPLFETIRLSESERGCALGEWRALVAAFMSRENEIPMRAEERARVEKSEARADTGEEQFSKLSREESSYTVERQSIRQAIFHT